MAFSQDTFPLWTPAAREDQECFAGDGKKGLVFLLIPGLFYFQLIARWPVACCRTAWCDAWPLLGPGSVGWPPSSAAWTRGWSPPALRGVRTSGGSGGTRSVGSACAGRIVPGFFPLPWMPFACSKEERVAMPSGTIPAPGMRVSLTSRWRRSWKEQKPWSPGASPGLFLGPKYKEEKYSNTSEVESPSPHTCKRHCWLHTGLHGWWEDQRVPLSHHQHLQGDVLLQRLPVSRGFSQLPTPWPSPGVLSDVQPAL